MKIKQLPFKKIATGIILILLVIQFIRIDKTNPPLKEEKDLISGLNPPPGITHILKTSCYDCHSNETAYPWYTNVAPVSWWIKNHINNGREELNFSEWINYTSRKKDHKLEECVEMVEGNEMPLYSYTLLHRNAILNGDQRHALAVWFESQRTYESEKDR